MARLVLTAENFAFGPISKLLYVAELLLKQDHALIFVGFGTSLQLAKGFPFSSIHEIDTDNPESKTALEKIISQADMVISSMDIPSVAVAKHLKKPVVWIDCLFWFWKSIPEQVLDVDLYVRERSADDSANEAKFGPKIKNLFNVGPIIGKMENTKRKRQVLISYGGGEATYWYKVGKDTNYPFMMTDILLNYVDWDQFDRITITTSERIVKELKKKFSKTRFEFACFPQEKFIIKLLQSEILLTTAGLVTTQVAFQSGTPTIFLPPSNDAHYLLLDELRKLGLAPASVHLSDFLNKLDMRGKSEIENIPEVLQQLHELEQSPKTRIAVGAKINAFVRDRNKWSSRSIVKGKKFIDSLGGNGAETTACRILQFLTDKGIE